MSRTAPFVVVFAALALAGGCSQEPSEAGVGNAAPPAEHAARRGEKPKNVLLVTFDTTRADHVGYASGRQGLTPTVDTLAEQGTWFSTCMTSQPLTLPAHTSILTGLYPFHHGVRDNGTYVVSPEVLTLPEILKQHGFVTHAFVSAFVLDSRFGLDQGFDVYDDDLARGPKKKVFMFKQVTADRTASKVESWLEDDLPGDRPFFAWVHFYDPHADYEPPPDVRAQFTNDPYSGEIHFADRELGRIVETLRAQGRLDDTLVVFVADHGEGLGEHGEKTHGMMVYETTIQVPLVLAGPGVPTGGRVDELVRTVDIVPTVLDLLGLESPSGLDGRSVRGLWEGEKEDRSAYFETLSPRLNHGWSELRGLRRGAAKVVLAPRSEAFDLASDPTEAQNLLTGDRRSAPRFEVLMAELEEIAEADPFVRGEQQQQEMDDETRAMLSQLGYVWTEETGVPREAKNLPDPKDMLEVWERFHDAQNLVRRGKYAEAVEALSAYLEDYPDDINAVQTLATAVERSGDAEGALRITRRLIELMPDRYAFRLKEGMLLKELGRYDEAEASVRKAAEMQTGTPDVYRAMGEVLLGRGRYDEAEQQFRKALEVDPYSIDAAVGLGNCLNRAGRAHEALELLEKTYEHDPTSASAAYNLGVVVEQQGNPARALELYREAVRLDPEDAPSWNNLGSLLGKMGRQPEAMRCLEKAHQLDPDNQDATYNLGALLVFGGQPAKGLPLLEEALAKQPDNERAAALRAWALEALGRGPEALAAWRALTPRMPEVGVQVARLELAQGNRQAAAEALRDALAKGGDKARGALAQHPELRSLVPPR